MKFGVENRNVNFQRELPERILSTHLPAVCSVLRVVAAVKAAVSAQHTQSSRAKLTCSSTAAWLNPILLPKTTKSSTAPACPVPCPRPRQRQAPRPSHDCCSTAPVAKLICDADFLSAALSKSICEARGAPIAFTKRRSGGRDLSVIMGADGIKLRGIAQTGPSRRGQARVHTLRYRGFPGSVSRRRTVWRAPSPRRPADPVQCCARR